MERAFEIAICMEKKEVTLILQLKLAIMNSQSERSSVALKTKHCRAELAQPQPQLPCTPQEILIQTI